MADHWTDDVSQLWGYAASLEQQHAQRLALDKACLRLYTPRPQLGEVTRKPDATGSLRSLTAYESFRKQGSNLSREVVGGAIAMVVRPMQVQLMPVGADYTRREFCKQGSLLLDGVFAANRWPEIVARVAEDSMWASVGAVKVYTDAKSEVRLGHVDPLGLFWDVFEGDAPLTLVEVHAIPRRRLMAEYPAHKQAIKDLPSWYPPPIPGVDYYGMAKPDTVKVVEATAVKIGDTPGRHAVVAQNLVLEDDAYNSETHNIHVLRWENDPRGFGGISLVRGVAPYHAATVRYQRMRMEQLKACIPVIWVSEDEELFRNISDLEYQIAKYSGAAPPTIAIAGQVSGDLTAEIEALRTRAYQENGVNFALATGQKPAGLNSAPAQREHVEGGQSRLQQPASRFEQFHKDVASSITAQASLAYQKKGARVQAPGTDFLDEVRWPKDLKEDQYVARAGLASGLSLTLSGKLEQLQDLANLGVLKPDDVGTHLKLPDLEETQQLTASPADLADKQINDCLAKALPTMPSPIQDVAKALQRAKLEYQLALKKGIYPVANTQCLRRYIRRCEAMLAPPLPPAPPVPPPADPSSAPVTAAPAA